MPATWPSKWQRPCVSSSPGDSWRTRPAWSSRSRRRWQWRGPRRTCRGLSPGRTLPCDGCRCLRMMGRSLMTRMETFSTDAFQRSAWWWSDLFFLTVWSIKNNVWSKTNSVCGRASPPAASLPEPSRSLRMYSSGLSSNASSSAPVSAKHPLCQTKGSAHLRKNAFQTGFFFFMHWTKKESLNSLLNSMLGTMTFSQMLVSMFWSSNRCL